ncbi:MAG: SDR family NAD(P)-dependent oxidoreductase, partial [Acidobacteriota bacterium]|nr:SDR family NAD(P)-dependent oxidoreductase [Acidobacteriota bacterium]
MSAGLSGKIVAITGASSGIGEATALACAGEGASVALAARRSGRLEALAERIEAQGGAALAVAADVSDEAEAHGCLSRTLERFGRVDVLVNNAGVMLLGPIVGADTEEWRTMIGVNVFGVLYCTDAALGHMREQGTGHIVTVSSVAGRVARVGAGVYNLTKFGVGAFSESLRQELAGTGVRVTLV